MKPLRIGTRESQLALWQARLVSDLLSRDGVPTELVPIKSEGDIDLKTPLYAMGVQGVFTRSLDLALVEGRIDLAVHSMKDVPTQLATGIAAAAVLKRASHRDLFVYKDPSVLDRWQLASPSAAEARKLPGCIATSSIRRRAQWLHRYPHHRIENLRGNVNTRLRKLAESNWDGALFAAAGLERIQLRPARALELDWMLPAPAQGAILVVCREQDSTCLQACGPLHDPDTALCTRIERDFLRELLGGCSTPISALATVNGNHVQFQGNILSPDGSSQASIARQVARTDAPGLGNQAARELLDNGGRAIADLIRHGAG